jgi:hypothetical protein
MRRRQPCLSVSKLGGGSYRSAPRSISGMICVECILDLLPYACRQSGGYSGGGRWDNHQLQHSAGDLYVPATESEAARAARFTAWDIRA